MSDYKERVYSLLEHPDLIETSIELYGPSATRLLVYDLRNAAAAIEELQALEPKLGEWIWDDKRCIYVCSLCGSPKVRENMDRQIIKEQAYCYSCGAKMEVQE